MADISKYVDKAHEQKEFAELAELPVDALQGVSAADAAALQQAFGIKTGGGQTHGRCPRNTPRSRRNCRQRTSPITIWELVLGKYLAAAGFEDSVRIACDTHP